MVTHLYHSLSQQWELVTLWRKCRRLPTLSLDLISRCTKGCCERRRKGSETCYDVAWYLLWLWSCVSVIHLFLWLVPRIYAFLIFFNFLSLSVVVCLYNQREINVYRSKNFHAIVFYKEMCLTIDVHLFVSMTVELFHMQSCMDIK